MKSSIQDLLEITESINIKQVCFQKKQARDSKRKSKRLTSEYKQFTKEQLSNVSGIFLTYQILFII